ncbi:MAG: cold shock domain-containing protein [Thermomicrobiales bacterium]|nr:cold shock domain-containing protein [Thermomicrobiales bacterium]
MATGTVKWFDPDRGFGFIAADDGTADRFVHRRGFEPGLFELADGDEVSFDSNDSPRGPAAVNVRVTRRSGNQPRQRKSDGYGAPSYGSSSYGGPSYDRASAGVRYGQVQNLDETPLTRGSVQRFDTNRGFGFILDETGQDIFFHQSAAGITTLRPGDQVEYRIVNGPKGLRAEQVRKLYA